MNGRTNSIFNRNIPIKNAIVRITSLIGSTITISKNGVTVAVLDASEGIPDINDSARAVYYYSVMRSNYGTWSINADTNPEVTKTVEITTNKVYAIDITVLYLYNYGTYTSIYDHTNVGGNYIVQDYDDYVLLQGSKTKSIQDAYIVWHYVNLTHFSTITYERSPTANNDRYIQISVLSQNSPTVAQIRAPNVEYVKQQTGTTGVKVKHTLDISKITGTWTVAVGFNTNGGTWNVIRGEHVFSIKLS